MGISNAVYFGSKVAQPMANAAAAPDAPSTKSGYASDARFVRVRARLRRVRPA
jgi:hypothetical protein